MSELPLDLRALEPPEPLLRVLEALAVNDGARVFLFAREPLPLYRLLAARGWRHRLRVLDIGFELSITSAGPPPGSENGA